MERVTVLPTEVTETPIKVGVSIINENPIGVLEKLGKYEFIYDYKVPNFWDNFNMVAHTKEGGSNANMIATSGSNDKMIAPSGFWSGQSFPQPVKINSEAQVGFFSKGNIVNVVRFDGNNAIIENINYKAPDPTVVKTVWGELLGSVLNKKEFSVPKDYLRKADDTLEPTLLTGINYGANMKPQPIYVMPPVKPIPFSPITQTILEENASFVLAKDFEYVSGYGSSYCSPDGLCTADMSPKFSTLKAGTKVTGRLFRETNDTLYKLQAGAIAPPLYNDYLAVKGYGDKGSINIPVEYLTKEVPTNSGVVVPAKNDNKNLLMIVGAFLVGYVVFSKGKSE
jgi:hypothetical protein